MKHKSYWREFVYESRKQGKSDMLIQEFFSKIGLEDFWPWLRMNVLGDNTTFVLTLIISLLVFVISRKYDSIILQIISGFIFIGVLVLKFMLI